MDSASKTRLSKVHPLLAERVANTIAALAAKGMDVRVVQGLRTYAEQDALYAQGRTRKGPKVTNARGGQSNHNFGLAVDLCPFDDGVADWDNDRAFVLIGAAGKANGLEWGGDWSSFPDRPHLQLKTGLKTADCHVLNVAGGLARVWAEADHRLRIKPKTLVAIPQTPATDEFNNLKKDLAEPGLLDNPPIEQPARPVDEPDTKAAEQPASNAAAPAPQPQLSAEASGSVDLRKERPSLFVKIGATFTVVTGFLSSLGIGLQTAFDRVATEITLRQIITLLIGLGIGALGLWFYDRSAQRSNALNQQKIANAADLKANYVELSN